MSQPIISVQNLSKAYRLGCQEQAPDTLLGAAKSLLTAPYRNLRELSRLNTFGREGQEETEQTLWALRDVSFDVAEGEVVGIIGRNGAGKSTLLKILSRITEPTSGRAVIRGRVSSLLEVGTGFHPELSGRDNIYMNGTILGMTKREIDSKFREIVEFSGVEKFLDTPIKRYSSGMQVRLAFAVAAHLEPEILIIDEVLAVGDAEFQKRCLGKMKDVASSGRTVVFVSHNMAAVQSLCTRAIVVDGGTIVEDAATEHAISAYASRNAPAECVGRLADLPRPRGLSPVIQSVEISGPDGVAVQSVASCGGIVITLHYRADRPIKRPRFGIILEDDFGLRLFFLQTEFQWGGCPDLPAAGSVVCRVPTVPLVPGRFYLTLGCASGGEQLDFIERACSLDVLESDVFGTGKLPPKSHGAVLVDASWEAPTQSELAVTTVVPNGS